MTYTFVVYSISTLVLFFYVIFSVEKLYPYPPIDWVYFLLLAIIPTILGHTLFNWSLEWLSTSTISMAILFEPVGAIILALLYSWRKTYFHASDRWDSSYWWFSSGSCR